jgi:hypothetical protein
MNLKYFYFFVILSIIFLRDYSSAQVDSTKEQWFQKFYSTRYLDKVLQKKHFNYKPANGVIPDSGTAVDIAVIVLSKAYGKETIEHEKPFTAILKDGYWIVYGSLPGEIVVGGVAEIVIRKSNGEIINISHGK